MDIIKNSYADLRSRGVISRAALCPYDKDIHDKNPHDLLFALYDRWHLVTTTQPAHDHVIHEAGHAYHLEKQQLLRQAHPRNSLEHVLGHAMSRKEATSERFALGFQLLASRELGLDDIDQDYIAELAKQQKVVSMKSVLWHTRRQRTKKAVTHFLKHVISGAVQWRN